MIKLKYLNLFLFLLILGMLTTGALYAQVQTRNFPLPIDVEEKHVSSTILAKVPCETDTYTFTSDSGSESPEVKFIQQQVAYLTSGNYDEFSKTVFPSTNTSNAKLQFDFFSRSFQKMKPDRLTGRFVWGGLVYALLNSSQPPHSFAPLLVIQQGNSFETGLGLMLNPVIQMLSVLGRQTQPNPFGRSQDVQGGYSIEFVSPVPTSDGNNSVVFCFSGQIVDCEITRDNMNQPWKREDRSVGQYQTLIDFFENSNMKLINGDIHGYFSDFSTQSQKRIQTKFKGMNTEQFRRYILYFATAAPKIKFILDAGQVKYIFYRTAKGGKLNYAAVAENNGQFQRVNEDFQGTVDGLFETPEFISKLDAICQ